MIRLANPSDTKALLEIYKEYIDTPITFETILPSETEFAERIREYSSFYPYLVYVEKGKIIGYAYAHRYKTRQAYRFNAELSIYVSRSYTKKGIGKALMEQLLSLLRKQHIYNVYSIITIPNENSVAFHESFGFIKTGTNFHSGYKNNQWYDVACYEKYLQDTDEVIEPISIKYIINEDTFLLN